MTSTDMHRLIVPLQLEQIYTYVIYWVTPVWGDFMFSVRFRRNVRCRKNFCLSRQNRLSLTLDI